jgi:hypothetical protein
MQDAAAHASCSDSLAGPPLRERPPDVEGVGMALEPCFKNRLRLLTEEPCGDV